jgi:hypothetical protein
MTGWQDYSDHVSSNIAQDKVIVELKDGSYGYRAHAAKGVIVDPSGLGYGGHGFPVIIACYCYR